MMTLVHYDEAMIHLVQFSLVTSHSNITFLLFRKILDRNWCYNLVNFVQFLKLVMHASITNFIYVNQSKIK